MDTEVAKKEFEKYLSKYDLEYPKMKRKLGHSYRVMENAKNIAKSLNLSEEEIEVASLIGLLHDIAKFEQIYVHNILKEDRKIEHGNLGAQILRESNYIRKYIQDDKYDDIILKSIKNHDKLKIENGLNDKEMLFAKIIRDADKLDIFYEGAEMFWNLEGEREEVSNSTITPEIWNQFKQKKVIDRKDIVTPVDGILSFIAFFFDINFKYTKEQIKKENYINKILDKFEFKDMNTEKQMEEVRKI